MLQYHAEIPLSQLSDGNSDQDEVPKKLAMRIIPEREKERESREFQEPEEGKGVFRRGKRT